MGDDIHLSPETQALKKNLDEATRAVKNWTDSKREGAEATVYTKSLASYYESALPKCK
jgi:hypothetical protein